MGWLGSRPGRWDAGSVNCADASCVARGMASAPASRANERRMTTSERERLSGGALVYRRARGSGGRAKIVRCARLPPPLEAFGFESAVDCRCAGAATRPFHALAARFEHGQPSSGDGRWPARPHRRPVDERPELVDDRLVWQPSVMAEAFGLDVRGFFASVKDAGPLPQTIDSLRERGKVVVVLTNDDDGVADAGAEHRDMQQTLISTLISSLVGPRLSVGTSPIVGADTTNPRGRPFSPSHDEMSCPPWIDHGTDLEAMQREVWTRDSNTRSSIACARSVSRGRRKVRVRYFDLFVRS